MANAPATKKTAHPKEGINPNRRNTQNLTNHINFLIRVPKSGTKRTLQRANRTGKASLWGISAPKAA
jgi:hypothetical protein